MADKACFHFVSLSLTLHSNGLFVSLSLSISLCVRVEGLRISFSLYLCRAVLEKRLRKGKLFRERKRRERERKTPSISSYGGFSDLDGSLLGLEGR
jgi:hypothetical protein